QMYGERPGELLKDDDWKTVRRMFEETGLEIYRSRDLIEVPTRIPTEKEQRMENFRLRVNELLELARTKFWDTMERGDEDRVRYLIVDLEKVV
ncbi:hypothetical protein EDD11_009023, partial [Mortierella claussenii]